jgi:hypothetical protein
MDEEISTMPTERYPLTFEKACHAKWFVFVKGMSQTGAAIKIKVNVGSISRVVRGLVYPDAKPRPPKEDNEA